MSELFLGFVVVLAMTGALMAVGPKNIFHNVLGLALSLFGVAGVFLYLNSELVALLEILIYIGGISIAIVFAIMLSNPLAAKPRERRGGKVFGAIFLAGLTFGALAWVLRSTDFGPEKEEVGESGWSVKHVGEMLLNEYVLVFELISLLLLVAIIGAILITKKDKHRARQAEESTGGETT